MAFVQLKNGESATEEEMRDFCTGQISYHKIPRCFVFVDEYPVTASGKIQKYKLREQAEDILAEDTVN